MANTEYHTATYHYDPYKNLKFIVTWDGQAGAALLHPAKQRRQPSACA
jgi:hypothetical protein